MMNMYAFWLMQVQTASMTEQALHHTSEEPSLIFFLYWIALALLGLGFSALFSGLETGAYRINDIWLHIHKNPKQATRLRRLLEQPARLLSTLLLSNNIANYLGTAAVTVLLQQGLKFSDTQTLVANLLILTPLLLIFAETLPKDLFARYSEQWMFKLAWLLQSLRFFLTLCGLVPLTLGFQRGILYVLDTIGRKRIALQATSQKGKPTQKPDRGSSQQLTAQRRMEHLLRDIAGQGIISQEQSALAERVIDVSSRTVLDEMIPWRKVTKVTEQTTLSDLWQLANTTSKSRFPVIQHHLPGQSQSGRQVLGMIDLYEILYEAPPPRDETERKTIGKAPITNHIHEVKRFSKDKPLRSALRELQEDKHPFAIVTDTRHKPIGIVTIKDLVEPITGELMNW